MTDAQGNNKSSKTSPSPGGSRRNSAGPQSRRHSSGRGWPGSTTNELGNIEGFGFDFPFDDAGLSNYDFTLGTPGEFQGQFEVDFNPGTEQETHPFGTNLDAQGLGNNRFQADDHAIRRGTAQMDRAPLAALPQGAIDLSFDSTATLNPQELRGSNAAFYPPSAGLRQPYQVFQAFPGGGFVSPHMPAYPQPTGTPQVPYFNNYGYWNNHPVGYGGQQLQEFPGPNFAYDDGYSRPRELGTSARRRKRERSPSSHRDEDYPHKKLRRGSYEHPRTRRAGKRARSSTYDSDDDAHHRPTMDHTGPDGTAKNASQSSQSGLSTRSSLSYSDVSERRALRKTRQQKHRASAVKNYQPEKPKASEEKNWIRINNTTRGLSTRTAKINRYEATSYVSRPHPVGDWRHGRYEFKYTKTGELSQPTMTAKQIETFITHYPTDRHAGKRLKIWIQKTPTDSARRYNSPEHSKCKFRDCPSRVYETGSIIHGHYRVAFDERWHRDRGNADPYHCAGYAHLYCMERFLDFETICKVADVEVDTRTLVNEPKGRFAATLNDQPEVGIAQDFIHAAKSRHGSTRGVRSLEEFKEYPFHRDEDRNEIFRGAPKPYRPNQLTYWMHKTKALSRAPAQWNQFMGKRELKSSHLMMHMGDLEVVYHRSKVRANMPLPSSPGGYKKKSKKAMKAELDIEDDLSIPEIKEAYDEAHNMYAEKKTRRKPRDKSSSTSPKRKTRDNDSDDEAQGVIEIEDEDEDEVNEMPELHDDSEDDDVPLAKQGGNAASSGSSGSRTSTRLREMKQQGKLPNYRELDGHSEEDISLLGPVAQYVAPETAYGLDFPEVISADNGNDTSLLDNIVVAPAEIPIDPELSDDRIQALFDEIPEADIGSIDEEALKNDLFGDLDLDWLPRDRQASFALLNELKRLSVPQARERIASAIKLRKRSVTFSDSNTTQEFKKEDPPQRMQMHAPRRSTRKTNKVNLERVQDGRVKKA